MKKNSPKPLRQKKRVIVVLGMHRSGTSAVAHGLQALGVELGNNLMLPHETNPTGFWEDNDIYKLNEELLHALDRNWHTLAPIHPDELTAPKLDDLNRRAKKLLLGKMEGSDVFGMKDPRLCLLLPFWKNIFRELKIQVGCVLVVRNPLSVAKSLEKRNGFPLIKSGYLWLTHYASALEHSAEFTQVVVDYDLLLDQPRKQMARIQKLLPNLHPASDQDLKNYVELFLDRKLAHTQFNLQELESKPSVPIEIIQTYRELQNRAHKRSKRIYKIQHKRSQQIANHVSTLCLVLDYLDEQEKKIATLSRQVKPIKHNIATDIPPPSPAKKRNVKTKTSTKRPGNLLSDHLYCIVTGMEHSGTTFLAETLKASLPNVGGGFECGLLLANKPKAFCKINPFYDWFCKPNKIGHWGLTEEQRTWICEAEAWPECYRRLSEASSFLPDKSLILDKTPRYVYNLSTVATKSPSIPILVITKDIILQYSSFKKRGVPLAEFLKFHRSYVKSVTDALATKNCASRIKIIRQSEVAAAPSKTIIDVLCFISALRKESVPASVEQEKLPTNLPPIRKNYSLQKEVEHAKTLLTEQEILQLDSEPTIELLP